MPGSLFAEPERTETLEGALERITFINEENAWSVVKLAVPGRSGLVTAVGNLLGVQPGENLRLTGRWVKDRKYGDQFKVDSYITVNPRTLTGIRRYLGSGLVLGIGFYHHVLLLGVLGLASPFAPAFDARATLLDLPLFGDVWRWLSARRRQAPRDQASPLTGRPA